jgi:Glycosyltransferase sugar-binding region containing DXD motif
MLSVTASTSVPGHIWFIWFGRTFPLFAELAVRSALVHNPRAQVSVWHSSELEEEFRARLRNLPRVTPREIAIDALVDRAAEVAHERFGGALDVPKLRRIWKLLSAPAARANVVRLLVLFSEGGVYLDTDTLTLKPFGALLELRGFCGLEHILWPKQKLKLASPYFWLGGPSLMLARAAFGKLAYGYRAQRRVLPYYAQAANNAVLGFAPGHPLIFRALQRMTELDEREWPKRFRLGTHLLQETLAETAGDPAVQVERLPPEYFYPLGPVISQHYFREYADPAAVCAEIVSARTHVIHWYASVSDLKGITAEQIREQRARTVFAALCAPVLDAELE